MADVIAAAKAEASKVYISIDIVGSDPGSAGDRHARRRLRPIDLLASSDNVLETDVVAGST